MLLDLFHDYLFKDIEPEQSGRKNLNTVGLITALGHSSERGQPIDFADYLAEHTSVLEEVSETATALRVGVERTVRTSAATSCGCSLPMRPSPRFAISRCVVSS
mgnify:CR=1 FL=1